MLPSQLLRRHVVATAVVVMVGSGGALTLITHQQQQQKAVVHCQGEGNNKTTNTMKNVLRDMPAAPSPSMVVVEPTTKKEFKSAVMFDGNNLYRLAVVGVRCMLGMCFLEYARAYAYGIYLAPSASQTAATPTDLNPPLSMWKKPQPITFMASSSYNGHRPGFYFGTGDRGLGYYQDVQVQPANVVPGLMIRLVMVRDVAGSHVSDGFTKTVGARISALGKLESDAATLRARSEAIRLCKEFHKIDLIFKDTVFDFFRSEDGSLSLVKDGQLVAVFHEFPVAWALVDAFLGPQGHCRESEKHSIQEFARKLQHARPIAEFPP